MKCPFATKKTPAPEGARVSYCRMGEGRWGGGTHPAYWVNTQWSLRFPAPAKFFPESATLGVMDRKPRPGQALAGVD